MLFVQSISVKNIEGVTAELDETIERISKLAVDMETNTAQYGSTASATKVFSGSLRAGVRPRKSASQRIESMHFDLATAYEECLLFVHKVVHSPGHYQMTSVHNSHS